MMKTVEIKTNEGYPVSAHIYEVPDSKNILIISSATGVKQSYYKKFAQFLSDHGVSVITFDYLGIGESLKKPIQKLNNGASDWGKTDLHAVTEYTKKNYPDQNIILLGHSIGGQLIGLSSSSTEAGKIILVAAQSGYWKFWKGFQKYKLWTYWKAMFPLLISFFNYLPSKRISGMENLPKNVAKQWGKWCLSPNYLFDHIPKQDLFFKNITTPLISVSIEDDHFAPRKAVDWLSKKYERADLTRIHLVPKDFNTDTIGHFGIFREQFKDNIWPLFLREII
ncbi:alpha/beta fold hydrolase [Chryseobacterium sp. PTM-20240506]|uniref:alpha/beta hydrolase family protein n=1 Tax=unclassified Chryseobacterium TaxID=2593645 RepID=UPI002359D659|nr:MULTISPECIES: alpha/beta fold hydrolase [unclassified Chryseobacterium]MDC8103595.1 alpha/beta fold hydrolase [Chryseobacterium sp. B21-037]MDQ1803200.1 alpha/beta fold hydrolase [Chryseobacterium sp. CKR4-1]